MEFKKVEKGKDNIYTYENRKVRVQVDLCIRNRTPEVIFKVQSKTSRSTYVCCGTMGSISGKDFGSIYDNYQFATNILRELHERKMYRCVGKILGRMYLVIIGKKEEME